MYYKIGCMLSLFFTLVFQAFADRVLVVLDTEDTRSTHSEYFVELQNTSDSLEFVLGTSESLRIQMYGEYLYDTIVLAASSYDSLANGITYSSFVKFVDEGNGNLIVLGHTDEGNLGRKLANSFGYDFYELGTRVYGSETEKLVKTSNITAPSAVFAKKGQVHLTGTGLYLRKNPKYSFPLLVGSSTTLAKNEFKNLKLPETGSEIILVGATQTKNNARVVISGSFDICSNQNFKQGSLNKEFCFEVTKWALQRKAVLRYSDITHYKVSEPLQKGEKADLYTHRDQVYFSIDIEELKEGKWVPFESDIVYMEFVMLDPKLRNYLKNQGKTYSLEFKVPDMQGAYQFNVRYNQPGYTWINTATEVAVRPPRHDENERFLGCALPYYSSVFATITGFVVFSFYFLYHKD